MVILETAEINSSNGRICRTISCAVNKSGLVETDEKKITVERNQHVPI